MIKNSNNENISKIRGWFNICDIYLFDYILNNLEKEGIVGNIIEIGVYYGKSFVKLSQYINNNYDNENLIGIDSYIRDNGQYDIIIENIKNNSDINIDKKVSIIIEDSFNLNSSFNNNKYFHNCKLIHIDGSHAGLNVYHDIELADQLLNENGILIIDDWHNCCYPDIQEAFYKYQLLHPNSFSIFLISLDKCYVCRPHTLNSWLWHIETEITNFLKIDSISSKILETIDIIKTKNNFTNSVIIFNNLNDVAHNDKAYEILHSK